MLPVSFLESIRLPQTRKNMNENNVKDIHVSQGGVPWKFFREGIDFKLLRSCSVTGTWVVLFRHETGTEYLPHKHIGAGEYFVLKGRVELRGGVENGGITAKAGDYGYEPNGIVHEKLTFQNRLNIFLLIMAHYKFSMMRGTR
jgi:quercetin dioxygenase-like cupin family protein